MCGGGGGDGGAADRERERQERIRVGTDAINRLFGKDGGPIYKTVTGTRMVQAPPMGAESGGDMAQVDEFGNPRMIEEQYTETVLDQAATDAANAGARDAKAAREAIYGTVKNDTRDFFTKQLDRDKAEAARAQKFALARAGTFSSSQAIDEGRKFQDALDEGLLEIANRSDTAATNLRTADEKTRLSLIDRLVSGVDQGTVVSSAMDQLNTNAENEKNAATSARMGNVFADLTALYNQNQFNAGGQSARSRFARQFGNVFPNQPDSNGTTVRY